MRASAIAPCVALGLLGGVLLGCPEQDLPCDPALALRGVSPTLSLTEGGRAFLALPDPGDVDPSLTEPIDVHVDGLGAGFAATPDGSRIILSAPYSITGRIPASLVASCGGRTTSAPLTLDIRPIEASLLVADAPASGTSPEGRSHAGLAVVGNAVIGVGGMAGELPLEDTWRLVDGAWSRIDVAGARGAVSTVALNATDLLVHDAVGAVLRVTFPEGDAPTSTQISAGGDVPTDAFGAGFVRDERTGVVLSVCGSGAARHCRVAGLPVANSEPLGSTVDVGDGWTLYDPTGFAPVGRAGAVVAFDGEARRLVLFGGERDDGAGTDAWSLQLESLPAGPVSWTRLGTENAAPPARAWACGAVDPIGHRFVVIGGADVSGAPVTTISALDLSRDDSTWRTLRVDNAPPPRIACSAAWDDAGRRIVVGFGHDDEGEHNDVWALQL